MRNILIISFFIMCFVPLENAAGSSFSLLPYPNRVIQGEGVYRFNKTVKIATSSLFLKEADKLKEILDTEYGLKAKKSEVSKADIYLHYDPNFMPEQKEAYQLEVTGKGVMIRASTQAGAFYAIQSLRQLLKQVNEKIELVQQVIIDYPAYAWRSFMLDEGRYFKGEKVVKEILDEMSRLKMNVFHWHLTDDQGWRIEIKEYPRLTDIGAFRDSTQVEWYESSCYDGKPHGGFYSQEQIKDIVAYAAERHIMVVPEIEMPGHSAAAVAAYPWLSAAGKDIKVPCRFGVQYDVFNVADQRVLDFLDVVVDEVIALFPSGVLHIGGDEVRYDQWNASPVVQRFIKEKGVASASDLQVWFTNRMSESIRKKGYRMMGWNDITGEKLHHFQVNNVSGKALLSPGNIVQFWAGNLSMMQRAAEQGQNVVNSYNDFTYMNYSYEYDSLQATYDFKPISLKRAYEFQPMPQQFPEHLANRVLGGGCQMWGEWIPTVESMNYLIYPRIGAYAEVLWTNPVNKNYPRFRRSLDYFLRHWKSKGIVYGPTGD